MALEASYGKPSTSDVVLRDNAIVKGIARMSNESFAERDDFDENSDEENYDRVYEDEATTPLQRYIQITEKQINEKRELIAKVREKDQDVCLRIDRVNQTHRTETFVETVIFVWATLHVTVTWINVRLFLNVARKSSIVGKQIQESCEAK